MIKGTVTYVAPPDVLKRDLSQWLKEALQEVVNHWHTHMLPGHFQRSAHSKYGYQGRNPKYIRMKIRRTGQGIDLIYTGRLRREALRTIRLSGTNKKAQGVLTVPSYAYMRRKYASHQQPDKAAEMLAITQDETEILAKVLDAKLQTFANQTTETKTVNT